jgi:protein-S-isoprenylcysteine O-methyltransferase Ste14
MAERSFLLRSGDFFFRRRNAVFPIVLGALFLIFRPQPFLGDPAADRWLDLAGLVVALAGQGLRVWVIGLAYIKRGGLNKQVYADRLVTNGMFAICRNPLYVGNALILAGLLIVHGHPLVWLFGALFFGFAYVSIVAAEEGFLAAKFGPDYAAYCARVNRWLPDFSKLSEAHRDMAFNWRRPLLKDYGSAVGWMAAMIALFAWERALWSGAGLPAAPYAAALLALAAAALLVRWLKKSKRLTEAA